MVTLVGRLFSGLDDEMILFDFLLNLISYFREYRQGGNHFTLLGLVSGSLHCAAEDYPDFYTFLSHQEVFEVLFLWKIDSVLRLLVFH